jgi:endo-1,3(4)-beta-glucanase
MASQDIFAEPIDTKPPPKEMKSREDHPVPRKGIASKGPLQTNKFYSNLFLGDQLAPVFTFPYSIAWSGGKGASSSWGMAVTHADAKARVFGQKKYNNSCSYYLNPLGIQSLALSAKELGNKTSLSMDSITAFSSRVLLSANDTAEPAVTFPLVQGMAYVTAQYSGGTPLIQSGVYFRNMTRVTKNPKERVVKYNFILEDGAVWRVYGHSTKGDDLDLKVINSGVAESTKPFHGTIQVSKDPCTPGSEKILDDGAGIYPVTLKLAGSASEAKGSYTFEFEKDGHQTGDLYMYALPHHVDSFSSDTKNCLQKPQLPTTTKGVGTLVKGTTWTMEEPEMPIKMGFAPWSPKDGSMSELSEDAKSIIQAAASKELSQNVVAQSNLDSMYFSGKVRATALCDTLFANRL